jgi:ABC-type lipoprotein export system ATPase subunit
MSDEALLTLEKVSKQYPGPDGGQPLVVLDEVDLVLQTGQSLSIVGPSGCGKSTLLNIVGTLDRPSGGHVNLDGRDLTSLDDNQLATLRSRELGFIFQLHHLLPQCTVLENVLVPTLVHGSAARAEAQDRARTLLDRVGLGDRLDHRPAQLSGGEQQRAAVVRALINQPRLVLADEPTGELDRGSAERLGDLLVELNEQSGVSVIVVTHSPELAARMQRVCEIRDGKLREIERHDLVDSRRS